MLPQRTQEEDFFRDGRTFEPAAGMRDEEQRHRQRQRQPLCASAMVSRSRRREVDLEWDMNAIAGGDLDRRCIVAVLGRWVQCGPTRLLCGEVAGLFQVIERAGGGV